MIGIFLLVLTTSGFADDPPRSISFKTDVAPILVTNCLGCHNDKKAANGLNMATFALLKKGGKNEGDAILEPGDPDASGLVEVVRPQAPLRMPLKSPPLSVAEIKTLELWVKQGAKFDGPSERETRIVSLVDPLKVLPWVPLKVEVSEPITSVAYSADGKVLAAAHGSEVLLFDEAARKPIGALTGHPGPVSSVRITPDSKTLIASGGRPGMFGAIVFWDLASKARRAEARGHEDSILTAALSPDGKTLATASYDKLIKIWDVASGKEVRTLKEHTDAVTSVAFSPDGKSLASTSLDRTLKVWDAATGARRTTFSDATAELYSAVFSPDSKTVFGAGVDRSIRAWDVSIPNGGQIRSVFAHDGPVLRLVVSPDGATLYSTGEDKEVKAWELATLQPRPALPEQPDWPLGLSVRPDGSFLAVGRYDGSLALYDAKSRQLAATLREAPKQTTQAVSTTPELWRNASLNPPAPRGAARGSKLRVSLNGEGVGRASSVFFAEPGISASIAKPTGKPDRNRLEVDLSIADDADVGNHKFWVQTPLGMTPAQNFAVSAFAESAEVEPNEDPARPRTTRLPATLIGTIARPGDIDHFRFESRAGHTVVFETVSRSLGSMLVGSLTLLDPQGRVLARSTVGEGEPVVAYRAERDEVLTLRVEDVDFGGSDNHFYRIQAGETAHVSSIFPLGIATGESARIAASGVNLPSPPTIEVTAGPDAAPGSTRDVKVGGVSGGWKMVVAEGPQRVEAEGNDEPAKANPVATPGGISARIGADGDVDYFRFEAKKGERLIVEVQGRRLGSPIDPVIEILDAKGSPIPRAVLRPVAETTVAFRDHPSTGRNIRLVEWSNFAVGDYLLMGRELTRLFELPRNPDDDAVFWGPGEPRNGSGERAAFLETTPEHHPLGQAIYKVEVHPPGATFPPGGVRPITLTYRNDDGGPGLGKDSRLTFDPPSDGVYLVRVEDVRGAGGERHGYHLVVRHPRPDFEVSFNTENPNIPRGGTAVLVANVVRRDGFDDPIDVTIEGLPPGITATSTRIERDAYTAVIVLSADENAPPVSPPTWHAKARAVSQGSMSELAAREIDPGGPRGGWITMTPEPNLKVTATPDRVVIRPGERVEIKFSVARAPGFTGRVPIEVRNLPRGVQVLNIGLNGVLVTEKQTERSIFLKAETWADAGERPFFAVGAAESLGTQHSSPPIPLVVLPSTQSPRASAGRP